MGGFRSARAVGAALAFAALAASAAAMPVVAGGDGVKAISVNDYHACAVKNDATLWCWGDNNDHEMGDGTTEKRYTPVQVERSEGVFLTGLRTIAPNGYDHTCAIKNDATVRCWGDNSYGQLGDLSNSDRSFAVKVRLFATGADLTQVKALALGQFHSCALRMDGTVWCWGANESGQLGIGETGERDGALQVVSGAGFLTGVRSIGAGWDHTCAIKDDSTVRCWGSNRDSQLGIGTSDTDPHALPLKVRTRSGAPLAGVTTIDGGARNTCARNGDGTLRCWGDNSKGQLGDGTTHDRHHPVRVRRGAGYLVDVTSLASGGAHACASTADRRVYCWGGNADGELGVGPTIEERHKAVRMRLDASRFITGVRSVRAGDSNTCVLRADASAWCMGYSELGQVGSGTTEMYTWFPEKVDFP